MSGRFAVGLSMGEVKFGWVSGGLSCEQSYVQWPLKERVGWPIGLTVKRHVWRLNLLTRWMTRLECGFIAEKVPSGWSFFPSQSDEPLIGFGNRSTRDAESNQVEMVPGHRCPLPQSTGTRLFPLLNVPLTEPFCLAFPLVAPPLTPILRRLILCWGYFGRSVCHC